jgi:lactoylglutathione lyase
MLRKIDCVMIRVEDPGAAALYYSDVFGLRRIWQDETSVGLGFPESDAEVVLHCNPEIPSQVDVYYLVDDVVDSIRVLRQNRCTVLAEPFDIPIGKCAVVRDPFGTILSMLDMSKGARQPLAN